MRRARGILTALVLVGATASAGYSPHRYQPARAADGVPYDWTQFNGGAGHSGYNTDETILSQANVAGLKPAFRVYFPSAIDSSMVYLSQVPAAQGRSLLFGMEKLGTLVALDARTGATIWSQSTFNSAHPCNQGGQLCHTQSTPAIDPNRQYVYGYGLDGYAHKYQVGDGTEITGGGWPELVTTKPDVEKGSSALTIATVRDGTTYLYVANGGYPGDSGDYQGHITAINLATGAQRVFNTLCSDQTVHFLKDASPDCVGHTQSAVWGRSGVVYDAGNDQLYGSTGNGDFDPSKRVWGDSVFALHSGDTGSGGNPVDTYTPGNFAQLQGADADLGSASPSLLPIPAGLSVRNRHLSGPPAVAHLGVQVGKDDKLHLLDLDHLGGLDGDIGPSGSAPAGGTVLVPQGGQVLPQPAVWTETSTGVGGATSSTTWLFVTTGSGICGLTLRVDANGVPYFHQEWVNGHGGASALIANATQLPVGTSGTSSNASSSVLYYAGSNHLYALDPTTGNVLLDDATIQNIHWESPVVANGMLYLSDSVASTRDWGEAAGYLTAYSLPAPDLALRLRRASQFRPGQQAQILISVRNLGNGDTTGTVTLTDRLPPHSSVVSATGLPQNWTCTATGGTQISCTGSPAGGTPVIAAGGGVRLSLTIALAGDLPHPALLVDRASVSTTGDSYAGDDTARAVIRVP